MESEDQNQLSAEGSEKEMITEPASKKENLIPASILVSSLILAGTWVYVAELKIEAQQKLAVTVSQEQVPVSELEGKVLPSDGVVLPVIWGDLGIKLASVGVIDVNKFKALYEQRGSFTDEYDKLLFGENNGKLKITSANSGYVLNLLWALGLANKNPILDTGEMVNPAYGGAKNFASTGGWTIAEGEAMDHYSRHTFFDLTPEQQTLVEKVSKGIYRPCCGNSVHFPDCNHGMAMLGLLELMASQDVSEQDMWATALAVNSYWFPNNYLTIATYMKNKGIEWKDVDPREMLGFDYSSSRGYANIASQVTQPTQQGSGGSGCSVDAGVPSSASVPKQQAGCGI